MEESFLWRMAAVGSSCIEIASLACTTVMPCSEMPPSFAAASMAALSPTAVTSMPYSRTAPAAPRKISPGALSPPIASMIMFMVRFLLAVMARCGAVMARRALRPQKGLYYTSASAARMACTARWATSR